MSYPYRRSMSMAFGGPLTKGVKYLIIVTLAMFVIQLLDSRLAHPAVTRWFALHPPDVIPGLQVWRLVTWLFVHGDLLHVLFNMLFLFMFGCQLERLWGTRPFVWYYFVCGVGAGLFTFIPVSDIYNANHIGASGAIYGILLAYGLYFPRNVIYFMMIFPIEARYFVIILGLLAFYGSMQGTTGISHVAHLGGLVAGYVYLRWGGLRRSTDVGGFIQGRFRRWRMKRLRKKFEQYYQKRTGGGSGPRYTVH